ncbi:MAG: sigma-70 family RNA polymerase sigma factor [Planctomycetes bacterium]|nr:sigma-70 family RNA polymerase sigma factor [Planctomycetota bacterium]
MAREHPDDPLQSLIARLQTGDPAALEAVIGHSVERLRRLARKMLKSYPQVRRWNETDDVLQNSLVRLHRALQETKPETLAGFFGLAATQIRRELIDLARHHYGPEGDGAHHASDPRIVDGDGNVTPRVDAEADPATGPATQAQWQEFHELVAKLPDEERQVFDLIFYQGLSQEDAGKVLGISERTVKRRWREARLSLQELTKTGLPGE